MTTIAIIGGVLAFIFIGIPLIYNIIYLILWGVELVIDGIRNTYSKKQAWQKQLDEIREEEKHERTNISRSKTKSP